MSDTIDLVPCCRSCRFSVMQDEHHGACHRYAPRPGDGSPAQWPQITAPLWCGEWALPPTDDELFADFLARSADAPSFEGIPVLPPMPTPADDGPTLPPTYDDPYEDPLR